jgi:hypothetical protein
MVYCFQHLGCVEEAYYCGRVPEAIEASIDQNGHRTIDDDTFDQLRPIYDCFHSFPVPFKCPLSPAITGEATGAIVVQSALGRSSNESKTTVIVKPKSVCLSCAFTTHRGFALDTQPIRLIPQSIHIHPFDVFALDTQPICLIPQRFVSIPLTYSLWICFGYATDTLDTAVNSYPSL